MAHTVFNLLPNYECLSGAIVLNYNGHYTVIDEVVVSMLTPEQRVEFAAHEAAFAGAPDFDDYPVPEFVRIEDAIEFADACEELSVVGAELSAFNAPSECYVHAYAAPQARFDAAQSRAVRA